MDIFVKGVRKVWTGASDHDVVALETTDHRLFAEKFSCLLGPSGCGKSSLIQIVGCLEPPSEAEVQIIAAETAQRQALSERAYACSEPGLQAHRTQTTPFPRISRTGGRNETFLENRRAYFSGPCFHQA